MIFNDERIAFVVLGQMLVTQEPGDKRSCHDWMYQDLHMCEDDYKTLTRGYILGGRIQFFTRGDKYTASDAVTGDVIDAAIAQYEQHFGEYNDSVVIGNGCVVGNVGEQWPPVLFWYNDVWFVNNK